MKDNRIEDFFNNSLESFNDAPSDTVWSGINDRLDGNIPFYQTTSFWIGAVTLLLLIGAGYALVSMNKQLITLTEKNEALIHQVETLKQINETQETTLVICQNSEQSLIEENNELKDFNVQRRFINPIKNQMPQRLQTHETSQNQNVQNTENSIEETKDSVPQRPIANQSNLENVNQQPGNKLSITIDENTTISALPFVHRIEDKAFNSASIESFNFEYINIFNAGIKVKRRSPTKIGLSVKTYALQTDLLNDIGVNNNLNFGQSIQGVWSRRLNHKTTVLGGMGYEHYKYSSNINSDNILSIRNFPDIAEQLGSIQQVTVDNHLINLSIGLQRDMPTLYRWNTFIGASANWNIYLPQQFEYQFNDGSTQNYQDNRYFAYFGTIEANLGIKKDNFQVAVFAENSLIPLGIEDIFLSKFGLKATILFDRYRY